MPEGGSQGGGVVVEFHGSHFPILENKPHLRRLTWVKWGKLRTEVEQVSDTLLRSVAPPCPSVLAAGRRKQHSVVMPVQLTFDGGKTYTAEKISFEYTRACTLLRSAAPARTDEPRVRCCSGQQDRGTQLLAGVPVGQQDAGSSRQARGAGAGIPHRFHR